MRYLCFIATVFGLTGCFSYSLTNKASDSVTFRDQHDRIIAAYRTQADRLVLHCEGTPAGHTKPKKYVIEIPLERLRSDGPQTSGSLPLVSFDRKVIRGKLSAAALGKNNHSINVAVLEKDDASMHAPPPPRVDAALDPAAAGPAKSAAALPANTAEAVFITGADQRHDAFVYLTDHPIWNGSDRVTFTINPIRRHPYRPLLVLFPAAVAADIAATPLYATVAVIWVTSVTTTRNSAPRCNARCKRRRPPHSDREPAPWRRSRVERGGTSNDRPNKEYLMRTLVPVLVCLAFASGCATSYVAPGRGANMEALGAARETQTNASIEAHLRLKPLAAFPTAIAVARVQSSGYRSQTATSYGSGAFSVVTTRDVEPEDCFERLAKLPMVAGVAPVNRLVLPVNLQSDLELRSAAASMRADLLLVYTFDTTFYKEDHAKPLTVVSLGLSPNKQAKVTTTASAVLLDTRNGYVYGVAETTSKRSQLANAWTSEQAVDDARRKAEAEAFASLVGEFEKLWPTVVARYATHPTAQKD